MSYSSGHSHNILYLFPLNMLCILGLVAASCSTSCVVLIYILFLLFHCMTSNNSSDGRGKSGENSLLYFPHISPGESSGHVCKIKRPGEQVCVLQHTEATVHGATLNPKKMLREGCDAVHMPANTVFEHDRLLLTKFFECIVVTLSPSLV